VTDPDWDTAPWKVAGYSPGNVHISPDGNWVLVHCDRNAPDHQAGWYLWGMGTAGLLIRAGIGAPPTVEAARFCKTVWERARAVVDDDDVHTGIVYVQAGDDESPDRVTDS
jgi:hypothetical protein